MKSLEERGISGDPKIGEAELQKREERKRQKRQQKRSKQEEKRNRNLQERRVGPNGEVLERSYDPRGHGLQFVAA
ncbi:MAG: hypothetical protein RJA61_480 [Candidatus Parcubacteria bacterium]